MCEAYRGAHAVLIFVAILSREFVETAIVAGKVD